MKTVSRFEFNLLRILDAVFRRAPLDAMQPMLLEACPQQECLRRDAVMLVMDRLAKGCVLFLAQQGGWRRERFLRGPKIVEGRLWQRTPPTELALKFSRHTLGFLIWLTANKVDDKQGPRWEAPEQQLTIADRLFLFLVYDYLAPHPLGGVLQKFPAFASNALCRLADPVPFLHAHPTAFPDFAPWTTGLGACILEVLQARLVGRWLDTEMSKGRIDKWHTMRDVGQAQESVLRAFFQAVEKARRLDLARFVLQTALQLLTENTDASEWTCGLRFSGPRLIDRTETHRAALAFLHQLLRLQEWTQRTRGVGYFDEGYAASQLWKADWENTQGDVLCSRAQSIIHQLDPLRPS